MLGRFSSAYSTLPAPDTGELKGSSEVVCTVELGLGLVNERVKSPAVPLTVRRCRSFVGIFPGPAATSIGTSVPDEVAGFESSISVGDTSVICVPGWIPGPEMRFPPDEMNLCQKRQWWL